MNMHIGTANNAGAILVVGRGLVVVPKLIHPLPPPLQSPETSPEHFMDESWMQVTFHASAAKTMNYWGKKGVNMLDVNIFVLFVGA